MTIWQPGKSLQNGKYTISKTLESGGFGITYKARENSSGRIVVIKTLNEQIQRHRNFKKFQQDFIDEAKRLSQFKHPNIVKYIDFSQENWLWFIVMEYVEGEDLESLLARKGRLLEAEALSYIKQIGSALKACHQGRILHRDIKPPNIIKRANKSEVVLIDFGIAREFVFNVTQYHTVAYTDGFAPPEQYERSQKRGDYSDVYALAATLYALLTGEPPASALDIQRASLKPPKDINPNISETVNRAVLKGMALDPKKRPQTVKDWLELLQPNGSASSRFTLNFSSVKTATPRVSRNYIVAIVVCLVVVVGLYIYWPHPSLGGDSTGDGTSQELQSSTSTSSETSENSQDESPPEELDTSIESSQDESPPEELDTSTESSQDESSPEELDTSTVPSETSENPQGESPPEEPETPPPSKPPVYSADYTRLENLLASKNFQEADEETLWIMLEITNRQRKGWLDVENIQKFPCADLDKLDLLWYDYSDGRFGFTIQKQQWFKSGGKAGVYDVKVADKFGDRVGWRVNKQWYKQINYQLSAPRGHFPVKANSYAWELNAPYFAERLDSCNIP